MNCSVEPDVASAYIDDELAPAEREHFEAHLESCERCAERVQTFGAIRGAVRRLSPGRAEPRGTVRARIEALRIGSGRAEPRTSKARRWALALTAVAAVLTVLVLWLRQEDPVASLVEDHLRSVPEALPAEVASDDPADVMRFFEGRLPFRAVAPQVPGAKLLGGRLCKVRGRLTQLIFYEREDRTLSLYVADGSLGVEGCRRAKGHGVCSGRRDSLTLTLIGELPPEELDRLLRETQL